MPPGPQLMGGGYAARLDFQTERGVNLIACHSPSMHLDLLRRVGTLELLLVLPRDEPPLRVHVYLT